MVTSPAAADILHYGDLVELVRADMPDEVILALLEGAPPLRLTVDQWLELRTLGASDRVLVAMLAAPPTGDASSPEAEGVRSFFEGEDEGARIFVLTNLDDEGRRIDGEVARSVRPNLVTGRSREEYLEEMELQRLQEQRERERAAAEPLAGGPSTTVIATASSGLLPEYLEPPGPVAYVRRGRGGYGFFWEYPLSHFYPPGSYTHNKIYHQPGTPGFGHYQLPAGQIFYNPPFPTAGSHRIRSSRR